MLCALFRNLGQDSNGPLVKGSARLYYRTLVLARVVFFRGFCFNDLLSIFNVTAIPHVSAMSNHVWKGIAIEDANTKVLVFMALF